MLISYENNFLFSLQLIKLIKHKRKSETKHEKEVTFQELKYKRTPALFTLWRALTNMKKQFINKELQYESCFFEAPFLSYL